MSGREQREAQRDNARQLAIEEVERTLEFHYDRVVGLGRAKQFLKGGLREKVDIVIAAIRTRADRLVKKMREELERQIEKCNKIEGDMAGMWAKHHEEKLALNDEITGLRYTIGTQHEALATQEGLLQAAREMVARRGETIKTLERRMASGFKDESAAVNALRREVAEKNEKLSEALAQCERLVEVAKGFRDETARAQRQVAEAVALAERASTALALSQTVVGTSEPHGQEAQ